MKKLLFVSAPRWNEVRYPTQGAMGGMADFPPIGMLYIAAYLKKHADVQTRLFDYNFAEKFDYSAIDREIEAFQPDLVGLTTYTFILHDIYRIARHIKEKYQGIKIVFGGKHTELYPREALMQGFVDYVVVGEGEEPMRRLVEALEKGERRPAIAGLWFSENGEIHDGGCSPRIKDLDVLPFPDLSPQSSAKYRYKFAAEAHEAIMVTSRGCPYCCAYCMSANADRLYVSRSPENVVAEIESLVGQGFRAVNFFDDNFNVDLERAKEICRLIIRQRLPIGWTMRGSADNFDEELVKLMVASRCQRALLGVESANEEILAAFQRKSNNQKIRETYQLLDRHGITTAGYFMLGFPGESAEMIGKTIDFARSLPLDFAQFVQVFPAPGSPFFLSLLAAGKMNDIYRDFSRNPPAEFTIPYYEDQLTGAAAAELCKRAYARFYFRFSLILRHLKKLKSFNEIWVKIKTAAALLRYSLLQSGK